jgi:predicted dehydrogenase
VPALRDIPGFELRGLSASTPASANAAAAKFGVERVFDDPAAMAESADIDMVVVAVKVPEHRDLLLPALRAGKIVLCEWPLAVDVEEATQLAAAVTAPAFIGLQARSAPTVRYVRDLVADGYVGTVLSTTMVGSGGTWGAQVEPRNAYLLDRRSGATMLTIPFGHAVDALTMVLGEFVSLSATMATRRSEVVESGSGRILPMTAADQVAVTGELAGGAVASVHYRGGMSLGTNFRWEINGTDGDLVVSANLGHLQLADLTLHGAQRDSQLAELAVPDTYFTAGRALARSDPHAYNVACAYVQILADLNDGAGTVPTFDHAVMRQQMLAQIATAAN